MIVLPLRAPLTWTSSWNAVLFENRADEIGSARILPGKRDRGASVDVLPADVSSRGVYLAVVVRVLVLHVRLPLRLGNPLARLLRLDTPLLRLRHAPAPLLWMLLPPRAPRRDEPFPVRFGELLAAVRQPVVVRPVDVDGQGPHVLWSP